MWDRPWLTQTAKGGIKFKAHEEETVAVAFIQEAHELTAARFPKQSKGKPKRRNPLEFRRKVDVPVPGRLLLFSLSGNNLAAPVTEFPELLRSRGAPRFTTESMRVTRYG